MSIPRASYFDTDRNKQILSNMVIKVRSGLDALRDSDNAKYKFLLEFIGVTLSHVESYPESFDERCIMNIASLGDRFMEEVRKFDLGEVDAEYLFAHCYRFVIEYQLSSPHPISSDLLSLLSRVSDFEYGVAATQVRYAGHQMLINIVQHYLYHPSLTSLKDLPEVIKRSESQQKDAEKSILDRETRVSALAEKLETYETAFNFVGLYSGFKNLRATKVSERRWNFSFLLVLGFLLLIPMVVKFFSVLGAAAKSDPDFIGLAALAGLELLLLYFFRVALQNFRSIKAQLLQIDLRMTLCQFVQSYAEYSKGAPEGSAGLLERFEQVVFSGIVNDESAIPSTFDGLDKLAELVGKIRK
ncbi:MULTISPECIES: hypothetical protein [unclassified Pseudomonas]|uniref:hypothetical protein n=1 Tax=unclassified Pseudomonas TaxID=196821 RepID=UPI000C2FEC35|nr:MULTISPECIES: hypothetical protein [unclassified Pseudomonas]MCU1736338.1 hypothetical protein [Pseudomonas sp. 20S_6.2_Bac1]